MAGAVSGRSQLMARYQRRTGRVDQETYQSVGPALRAWEEAKPYLPDEFDNEEQVWQSRNFRYGKTSTERYST
jgi:hypothetical protein